MNCKACGKLITTNVCPYCGEINTNLFGKEKIVDMTIIIFGIISLLIAITILSEVLSPNSPRSRYSDSDGYIFFFWLILGVGFIAWAVSRKIRRKQHTKK